MSREIALPTRMLASKVMAEFKEKTGYSDTGIKDNMSMSTGMLHFHGATSTPIAWNDVQEILYYNDYIDETKKLEVPSFPTEGYNQHSHTSEYDGGVIAGITGNHNHSSNSNGGFAFAVYYPSTGVPQADWE